MTLKVMNSSEELVDAPAEGPFGPGWASVAVMASTRRRRWPAFARLANEPAVDAKIHHRHRALADGKIAVAGRSRAAKAARDRVSARAARASSAPVESTAATKNARADMAGMAEAIDGMAGMKLGPGAAGKGGAAAAPSKACNLAGSALDLEAIRSDNKRELLELLDGVSGRKALVLDAVLGQRLNHVLSEGASSLRDHGVAYFRELRPELGTFDGEAPEHVVYLARCTVASMLTIAGHVKAALRCVETKYSTRLQCARTRRFRRNLFGCASRTRREQSIRPKISRIDFDLTELENSQVWSGPPKPAVGFHTGSRTASSWSCPGPRRARGPSAPSRRPRAGATRRWRRSTSWSRARTSS